MHVHDYIYIKTLYVRLMRIIDIVPNYMDRTCAYIYVEGSKTQSQGEWKIYYISHSDRLVVDL